MIVHDDLLKEAAAAAMLEEVPAALVEKEIETTTEQLLESSQAVGEISRNVEKVGIVAESMESFVGRFMDTVPEGEWNARTARQFQLGMGSILASAGVSVESSVYCSSFEAVGKTEGADENRTKTKEKSEGLLKRMWEALKAAIASFISTIGNFVTAFKNNVNTVDKLAKSLRGRVQQTKGNTEQKLFEGNPSWAKYTFAGITRLTPKAALSATGNSVKEMCKGWEENFLTKTERIFTTAKEGGDNEDTLSKKFPILPGPDVNMYPGLKTVSVEGTTYADVTLKVTDTKPPTEVLPTPVLTKAEVLTLAEGLSELYSDLTDVSNDLNRAVSKLKSLEAKLKLDDADKVSAGELSKLLGKIVIPVRTLAPIAIENARNAYRHGDASLKLMK